MEIKINSPHPLSSKAIISRCAEMIKQIIEGIPGLEMIGCQYSEDDGVISVKMRLNNRYRRDYLDFQFCVEEMELIWGDDLRPLMRHFLKSVEQIDGIEIVEKI